MANAASTRRQASGLVDQTKPVAEKFAQGERIGRAPRDLTMTSISRCRTRRYRAFAPYSAREAFASSIATIAGNAISSWPTSRTRLDVHSYTLDAAGLNVGGVPHSGEHLTGRGVIAGYPVRCIPPEWLVKFHTGYELHDNDWHDVRRFK